MACPQPPSPGRRETLGCVPVSHAGLARSRVAGRRACRTWRSRFLLGFRSSCSCCSVLSFARTTLHQEAGARLSRSSVIGNGGRTARLVPRPPCSTPSSRRQVISRSPRGCCDQRDAVSRLNRRIDHRAPADGIGPRVRPCSATAICCARALIVLPTCEPDRRYARAFLTLHADIRGAGESRSTSSLHRCVSARLQSGPVTASSCRRSHLGSQDAGLAGPCWRCR